MTQLHFLTLPLEIRSQIFSHLFEDFALIVEKDGPRRSKVVPYPTTSRDALHISRTNRQLRSESLAALRVLPIQVTFRLPFIEHLVPLPTVPFMASIRVVVFPSRFGSHALLSQLPNLQAIGVCRNALGNSSPDLRWAYHHRVGTTIEDWLTDYMSTLGFILNLCQQWILDWYRNPARTSKIWCRLVIERCSYDDGDPAHIKQAVWVDLDRRLEMNSWVWCRSTPHLAGESVESAKYNPPPWETVKDQSLQTILRWWTPD